MNKEELIKQMQELEKALEAKKAEIERLEKQDRLKNYADVKAGETFTYKRHEYTKLRNGKAIINDYDNEHLVCPFDNVDNIYEKSLIRHYINSERFWIFLGLGFEDLESCELLSKEEYEENEDIIKYLGSSWWLRSGYYDRNDIAYYVGYNGCVDGSDVNRSIGVRPSFDFRDDIEVEVINE